MWTYHVPCEAHYFLAIISQFLGLLNLEHGVWRYLIRDRFAHSFTHLLLVLEEFATSSVLRHLPLLLFVDFETIAKLIDIYCRFVNRGQRRTYAIDSIVHSYFGQINFVILQQRYNYN